MTAKIKLNAASGGGSFSLQAPSSSANNRVFTLPDSADATLLTSTSATGKILQVISTAKTDTFSESVAGGSSSSVTRSSIVTGLTATITPSATSSKVFVQYSISTGENVSYMILTRSGSDLAAATGNASGNISRITTGSVNGNDSYVENISGQFLDSPSSTSALTYGIKLGHGSSSTKTLTLNLDSTGYDDAKRARAISTITLMEVGA